MPHLALLGSRAWRLEALVATFITVEAPLSGMSMNPARTLASALIGHVGARYGSTSSPHHVGSGANVRPQREAMLKAARRRELDIILVWRLDRWGRSLLDLIGTLQETH